MTRPTLRQMLTYGDTWPTELLVSLYTLAWGLMLALPGDSLAIATAYQMLATLAPEWVWSVVCIMGGVIGIASLCYGRRDCRLVSLMGIFIWWGFMALVAGLASSWTAAGSGMFGVISVSAAWAYWRVSRCDE